jgi:hypothetical protein
MQNSTSPSLCKLKKSLCAGAAEKSGTVQVGHQIIAIDTKVDLCPLSFFSQDPFLPFDGIHEAKILCHSSRVNHSCDACLYN